MFSLGIGKILVVFLAVTFVIGISVYALDAEANSLVPGISSVDDAFADLKSDIDDLADSGDLGSRDVRTLTRICDRAEFLAAKGELDRAVKMLERFKSIVTRIVDKARLSDAGGDTLIDSADKVINEIRGAEPLINEILYDEFTPSTDTERQHEWVEIYNGGAAKDMDGWTISDRDGSTIATLPSFILPSDAYLVVHFTAGVDDLDFTDGMGDFYTGAVLPVLADDMDEVGLYSGIPDDTTIVDFVSWEGAGNPYMPGTAHDFAVAAGDWTDGEFFNALKSQVQPFQKTRTVYPGDSIGRDKDSTDTDLPSDWDITGGQDAINNSPRRQNFDPLQIGIGSPLPPPPMKEWTFMVYLDGDDTPFTDEDGDFHPGLEENAFIDLNEMEDGLVMDGDVINVVVLVDGFDKIHQVIIEPDGSLTPVPGTHGKAWRGQILHDSNPEPLKSKLAFIYPTQADAAAGTFFQGEPNMGDPATLNGFINWAKANFPAQKFALVLWDHGLGWKAVEYDSSSDEDSLHMQELTTGLGGHTFNLIGFDACLMGMTEIAYQVEPFANVMVASEETIDGNGWDYKETLKALVATPTMTEQTLGGVIVQDFHNFYNDIAHLDEQHTLSAVDLKTNFMTFISDVSDFADEMRIGIEDFDEHLDRFDNEQADISFARILTEEFDENDFIDLFDFAEEIDSSPLKPEYKTKAPLIMNHLMKGGTIILDEEHGDDHDPGAHGLSIYFPEYQTKEVGGTDPFDNPSWSLRDTHDSDMVIYAEDNTSDWGKVPYSGPSPHPLSEAPGFLFPTDTQWDEFLHRYYKPVADAGEDQVLEVGSMVMLDGSGSSDSDGSVDTWIWDLHNARDEPPVLPGAGGACGSTDEDWECDRIDETNDDKELEGEKPTFTCNEDWFMITLTVHDDHNEQSITQFDGKDQSHENHWKTDQDDVMVKCVEIDHFETSLAELEVLTPLGAINLEATGPTTIHVEILKVEDPDGDGLDSVATEMVSMDLSGSHPALGQVQVTVSSVRPTTGEIEELVNDTPGTLDLPPFGTGTATSFFDVFFEITVEAFPGQTFHNEVPKHMETIITFKPPAKGESYFNPDVIPLVDQDDNPTGLSIGIARHTPDPLPGEDLTCGVESSVIFDPAEHFPFIGPLPNSLDVSITDGQITITGAHPWVEVTGTIDESGVISATGNGIVADIENIDVEFNGTLLPDGSISGQYGMGVSGGLFGEQITYQVDGLCNGEVITTEVDTPSNNFQNTIN